MSARTNLVLDLAITAGFLVVSNPPLTGMAVHEWLGVAFGAAALTHVLLHWDWVVGLTRRLFGRLRHAARLNYAVDVVLFVTFTAAVLSGLLTSREVLPLFGIDAGQGRAWRGVHHFTANVSLMAVAVHVGLHWTWLATHLKRLVGQKAPRRGESGLPPLEKGATV